MISGREVSAGVRKGGIRTFFAHPTLCIGGTRGARRGQTARSRCLPGADSAVVVPVGGRAAQVGAHRGQTARSRCFPRAGRLRLVPTEGGRHSCGVCRGRSGQAGALRRKVRPWRPLGVGRLRSALDGIDGAAAASVGGGCMCFSALSIGVILLHTSFLGCSIYGTLLLSSP